MNVYLSSMNSSENCPMCSLPMGGEMIDLDTKKAVEIDTDVVGHPSLNGRCCYHRTCMEKHAKLNNAFRCYICDVPFKPSSLNLPKEKSVIYAKTFKDRAMDELKLIGKDALIGVSAGLTLGGLDLFSQRFIFKSAPPIDSTTLAGMALAEVNYEGMYSTIAKVILNTIVISGIENLTKEAVTQVIGTTVPQGVVFIATMGLTTGIANVVLKQFYRNVFDPILDQWRAA